MDDVVDVDFVELLSVDGPDARMWSVSVEGQGDKVEEDHTSAPSHLEPRSAFLKVEDRYVLVIHSMVRRQRVRWQWRLRSSWKCSCVRSRQRLSGSRVEMQQSSSLGSDEKGT